MAQLNFQYNPSYPAKRSDDINLNVQSKMLNELEEDSKNNEIDFNKIDNIIDIEANTNDKNSSPTVSKALKAKNE